LIKNGIIVFAQWDGTDYEIIAWTYSAQITNDDLDDTRPQVNSSSQIVWMKWDGSDYETYAY
jgi:hypothetical protein